VATKNPYGKPPYPSREEARELVFVACLLSEPMRETRQHSQELRRALRERVRRALSPQGGYGNQLCRILLPQEMTPKKLF